MIWITIYQVIFPSEIVLEFQVTGKYWQPVSYVIYTGQDMNNTTIFIHFLVPPSEIQKLSEMGQELSRLL